MRAARVAIPFVAVICLVACAGANHGSVTGTAATPVRDPSRMDTTELVGFTNLYDAIASRRSDWLRPVGGYRGTGSTPGVGVFIQGQSIGHPVDYMRELRPGEITAIRRIPPSESLHTYGFDWAWGGIVVTMRR